MVVASLREASLTQHKIDPIVQRTLAAHNALAKYREAKTAYDLKMKAVKASGLKYMGNAADEPVYTDEVKLGDRLAAVSRTKLSEFEKANTAWRNSGKKDHSLLDTGIASLRDTSDPDEQYVAAMTAIGTLRQYVDYQLSDVIEIAKICPPVLHNSGLVQLLVSDVAGRMNSKEVIKEKYGDQTSFLDMVLENSDYLDEQTNKDVQLTKGRIVGRTIDMFLSIDDGTAFDRKTLKSDDLIQFLEIPADAHIDSTLIVDNIVNAKNVPAAVGRLSRATTNPDAVLRLQGVVVGLAESMLARRPGIEEMRGENIPLFMNLTEAAFNGFTNLFDPKLVTYTDWLEANYRTPIGKLVSSLDILVNRSELWRQFVDKQAKQVDDKAKK